MDNLEKNLVLIIMWMMILFGLAGLTMYIYAKYFEDKLYIMRQKEIIGIVEDKYVKEMSHGTTYLKIKNDDLSLSFFDDNFIKNVQIGDSVYTKAGDSIVTIVRGDSSIVFPKVAEWYLE